jgi:DNA-directed RNA polymerase specialized sigma subunit
MRNEELIVSHVNYAFGIVNHRKSGFDYERDDQASEALLALVIAGRRFDPSRGVSFTVWVRRRIAGALQDWQSSRRLRYGFQIGGCPYKSLPVQEQVVFQQLTETNGGSTASREPGRCLPLEAALCAIPARLAFILRQRYVIGEECEDIAAVLKVSPGRISQLTKDGLRLMREQLALRGVRKVADLV